MKLSISTDSTITTNEEKNRDGNKVTVFKHGHGLLKVVSDSPYSPAQHSIIEFVVDEGSRGQGIGDKLLKEAVRRFGKDFGAQASTNTSIKLLYKNGFRMAANPHGTLEEAFEKKEEDSSVYMRLQKK